MRPRSTLFPYETRLRTTDPERAIVESVRTSFVEAGLPEPSLNDIFRHLIRRAEMGIPRDANDGLRRLQNHMASCEQCEPYKPPRCLDGVYLRELNRQFSSCLDCGARIANGL